MESEARKSLLSNEIFTLENTERIDSTIESEAAEMDIGDSHMCRSYGSGETSTENEHDQEDDEVRSCQLYASNDDWERSAALLLTVKERFKLTQSAIDFITQQVHNIISYGIDDIQKIVEEWIESQGISANFTELAARLESLRNPFAAIETEYMQSKFYWDHFNLVVRSIHCLILF